MTQHNALTADDATSTQLTLNFVDRSPQAKLQAPANRVETSRAAAVAIEPAAPTLRLRVYEAINKAGGNGLTRPEIADTTGIDLQTVCPRIGELKRLGLIIEQGTRPTAKGRAAGILIAKDRGGYQP